MKKLFMFHLLFCAFVCKGQNETGWLSISPDTCNHEVTYYSRVVIDTSRGINDMYKTIAYIKNDTLVVKDSLSFIKMLLMNEMESDKYKGGFCKSVKFEDIKYPEKPKTDSLKLYRQTYFKYYDSMSYIAERMHFCDSLMDICFWDCKCSDSVQYYMARMNYFIDKSEPFLFLNGKNILSEYSEPLNAIESEKLKRLIQLLK